jgi:hypothetical protein
MGVLYLLAFTTVAASAAILHTSTAQLIINNGQFLILH